MVRAKMSNKKKQQSSSAKSKTLEIRRAELLLLEAQRSLLEKRIQQLDQVGETNLLGIRNSKRQSIGLLDRFKGSKRTKYETPITLSEMFSECRKLLAQLRRNKNAVPFLSPVDPVAWNCLDYFAIIEHPMDFQTISGKLKATNCRYRSPLEFRDDLRLVFKNCMRYNPEGHQIRIMGDRMSDAFETLWQSSNLERIFQDRQKVTSERKIGAGFDSANQGEELGGPNGEKARLKRKTKEPTVEYSLQRLTPVNSKMQELMFRALKDDQSIDVMDMEQPMSFWQRRQLSQELDNLPNEALTKLHPILMELNEREFIFDELEDQVLWSLKSFLNGAQNPLEANGVDVETPVDLEQPPDDAEQNSDLQNCNVQPLNGVLNQAAENKIKQNQISEVVAKEGPIQEVREDAHSNFGCCGHEIMKKTPRSNIKDDLIEEPASGALH